MRNKNKFGFGPIDDTDLSQQRKREVGPMGAAVREAASSLNESTESLVEQRRQNAVDAKEFRNAQNDGRVLFRIDIGDISVDDLPRDRLELEAVAASDEMEELKASIRERGQKEPIEVYRANGRFQLKKGWRRLTALRQLLVETGDNVFSTAVARVAVGEASRVDLYIDMVEENVVREDLTFAEMAQVAITAAADPSMEEDDAELLVGRLYASLHKMKKSYIRSFVQLLLALGDDLKFPKQVSRNLGVEVARKIKSSAGDVATLRAALATAASAADQSDILGRYVAGTDNAKAETVARPKRVKYEFHVGATKVTARKGECRILSGRDFASIDRQKLQRAIEAFEATLAEG